MYPFSLLAEEFGLRREAQEDPRAILGQQRRHLLVDLRARGVIAGRGRFRQQVVELRVGIAVDIERALAEEEAVESLERLDAAIEGDEGRVELLRDEVSAATVTPSTSCRSIVTLIASSCDLIACASCNGLRAYSSSARRT